MDLVKSVSENLLTIAENSKNLYMAGAEAFGLKGSVSGSMIIIDDVAPARHAVKISSSSQSNVIVSGKNFFDPSILTSDGYGELTNDGSIYIKKPAYNYVRIYEANGVDRRVSMSYLLKTLNASGSAGQQFYAVYEGSTAKEYIGSKNSQGAFTQINWQSNPTKKLSYIQADAGTNSNETWLKDIQLEFSETITPYEPYMGTEYTPGTDGTIDGVMSISPVMIVKSMDGVSTVECEYFRDVNKLVNG